MTLQTSIRRFLGAGLMAAVCVAAAPPSYALDAKPDVPFADIVSRVKSSVVTVASAAVDDRQGRRTVRESNPGGRQPQSYDDASPLEQGRRQERQFSSIGSGFIIDPSGLVVTNNHVIEGGTAIYVILADGTEMKVDRVIGRDPKTDVTLLKVTPKPSKPLQAVSFGDSGKLRVGDWVIAIGNPFGLNGTVTAGIISGRGRDINAGPYDDFLQTDAAINRGNSGGPLFNAHGDVIGINTAIFSPSGGSIGLGFAIPSNTAQRILDQLKRYGETRWGWIGARLQTPSDDLANGFHLAKASGALVARIEKGGPADIAGLQEGDLVLSFAGAEVKHARDLPRIVAQAAVGEDAAIVVLRGGERKTLTVKVGLLEESKPAASPPRGSSKRHRLQFEPSSEENFAPLKNDSDGVFDKGAWAQKASEDRLHAGDVIVAAEHKPVRNLGELEQRLSELRQLGRTDVLLTVRDDQGGVRFASCSLHDE